MRTSVLLSLLVMVAMVGQVVFAANIRVDGVTIAETPVGGQGKQLDQHPDSQDLMCELKATMTLSLCDVEQYRPTEAGSVDQNLVPEGTTCMLDPSQGDTLVVICENGEWEQIQGLTDHLGHDTMAHSRPKRAILAALLMAVIFGGIIPPVAAGAPPPPGSLPVNQPPKFTGEQRLNLRNDLVLLQQMLKPFENPTDDIFDEPLEEVAYDGETGPVKASVACHPGSGIVGGACVDCLEGSYSTGNGICELCGKGSYQDKVKMAACKACPNGLTTLDIGSVSLDQCLLNPPSNEDQFSRYPPPPSKEESEEEEDE